MPTINPSIWYNVNPSYWYNVNMCLLLIHPNGIMKTEEGDKMTILPNMTVFFTEFTFICDWKAETTRH